MARVRPSTTPNPNAMKFTLDVALPARIDTTRDQGDDTPFVRAVLAVDGVASVFGVNDFVTVMRDPDTDWNTIVCAVEAAAAAHLEDEPGARPAEDEVALARNLLRDAVVAPKPTTVEIRKGSVALSRTVPRRTQAAVRVHSDRSDELGERMRDAPMGARFDAEFVVAAPNVLHQRVTADDHSRRAVTLESAHRSKARFEPPMVGFDPIVRVLGRVVKRS